MNAPKVLRELLAGDDLVWGPGVYDGISARIAQSVGFPILYMTGAGTAASRIGQPDLGLTTATEMVGNARMIQSVIEVPLIADADHGYGGVINVVRTVHEFEQVGVGGIHIEDQAFPKRCGHLQGKVVIERAEFKKRIAAAAAERWNKDFVLIARTDARAVINFEEALARVEDAFDAGADIGFLEAPQSVEEIEKIAKRASGPMLLNMATGGRTPSLTRDEIKQMGFKMAVWPGVCTRTASFAIRQSLQALAEKGTDRDSIAGGPEDFFRMVGLDEVLDLADRYS
ncbi:hypothetical protein AN477_17700 [Alicyclobacillus ferrooxydans]|uniref:Carboxyvinyl-carboxyphosphonate phosphorylmutase n=2 Tax=Alicyclobacillus ferrooxydans TaxID=471514 RepID=A0A0P9CAL9_9BACL|nr:hypothetical protein AN477_17700 [Alicyclobacillus ferrooxydans]